jgi:hypothetical protein
MCVRRRWPPRVRDGARHWPPLRAAGDDAATQTWEPSARRSLTIGAGPGWSSTKSGGRGHWGLHPAASGQPRQRQGQTGVDPNQPSGHGSRASPLRRATPYRPPESARRRPPDGGSPGATRVIGALHERGVHIWICFVRRLGGGPSPPAWLEAPDRRRSGHPTILPPGGEALASGSGHTERAAEHLAAS